MNHSHSILSDWGLKHVSIEKHYTILDVGCGGGGTVHKLAGIAVAGKVYGIDWSEDSVIVSRRTNKQFIKMVRVEIQSSSVSCLPFSDNMFDLVTAVNTYYYWPDLIGDMKEVLRVLKPGGKLLILGEAYKGGKHEHRNRKFLESMGIMTYYGVIELGRFFSMAGYSDVQMFEKHEWDFICGVGTKPSWSPDGQDRGPERANNASGGFAQQLIGADPPGERNRMGTLPAIDWARGPSKAPLGERLNSQPLGGKEEFYSRIPAAFCSGAL